MVFRYHYIEVMVLWYSGIIMSRSWFLELCFSGWFGFFLISSYNCSLSFFMGLKVLCTGSSHLRGFNNRDRGNKGLHSRDFRCNRKGNIGDSRSNGNVCSSNTETIDRVSNIVHSLKDTISINILVTTAGNAKSILCLSLGRVDVLIAKAKLTKLILSMELA